MKHRPTTRPPRQGHTLIELVTAMVAASMLLAGLASTMYIGQQIALTPATSQLAIDNTKTLFELTEELRYALHVVDRSPTMIEFVVDDRNGDSVEESIRYEWGGTAGDPIERTFNHGTPVTIVESVEAFALEYLMDETTEEIETFVESGEVVLWQQAAAAGSDLFEIRATDWVGQHLLPLTESGSLGIDPNDIIRWKLNKVQFVGKKKNGGTSIGVQFRPAGSGGPPTSGVFAQIVFTDSDLGDSYQWHTAEFSPPISNLSPHADYAIVLQHLSGDKAAHIQMNTTGGSGLLTTDDSGATWAYNNPGEMSYAVLGTYATPDTPISFTRKWLTRVDVSLQSSSSQITHIKTSTQLENRPELLNDYNHADFDTDPTLHDKNGDGQPDWATVDDDSNPGNIIGGVWHTRGLLTGTLNHDSTQPIHVSGRLRGTTAGAAHGAFLSIEFTVGPSNHGDVAVALELKADGSQTVVLYYLSTDGVTYVPAFSVPGLSNAMHDVEYVVFPERQLVQIEIDGVDYGTHSFTTLSDDVAQATCHMGTYSTGEIDSAMFGIGEGA